MSSNSKQTFTLYRDAPNAFKPSLLANENAYLEDILASSDGDSPAEAPISSGLFRLEPGTPLNYTYTYDEMKIILEGDFTIKDNNTGETVTVGKGDHFFFPKGVSLTFTTEKGGLAFYVGQRKRGAA